MWKAKDAAAAGRKTLGVDDDSSDEDDEPAKKRRSRGIGVDNPKAMTKPVSTEYQGGRFQACKVKKNCSLRPGQTLLQQS